MNKPYIYIIALVIISIGSPLYSQTGETPIDLGEIKVEEVSMEEESFNNISSYCNSLLQ